MDTDLLTGARAMAILWTLLLCAFTAPASKATGGKSAVGSDCRRGGLAYRLSF